MSSRGGVDANMCLFLFFSGGRSACAGKTCQTSSYKPDHPNCQLKMLVQVMGPDNLQNLNVRRLSLAS